MINPLWDGCISSNDDEILAYLEDNQTAHLSWSSQGRGYFLHTLCYTFLIEFQAL